eukprot:m.163982 g.163982  ORF g.163982 m.163982 type:complete len:199 (+) comp12364_c0_seq1:79-675(+)
MCFLSGKPLSDKEREKDPMGNNRPMHGREWQTDMCHVCCNGGCCPCLIASVCCCPCACYLRNKALQGDMSKYQCCQGYICRGCTSYCKCCENNCPCCTLFCESFLCNCFAISATRMWVQEERQILTDPCDNRIIRFNNCCQLLACFCYILAIFCDAFRAIADLIGLIADIVYIITSGCMQAQTYVELSKYPTPDSYPR